MPRKYKTKQNKQANKKQQQTKTEQNSLSVNI